MDTPRLIETGTGSSLEFRGRRLYSGKTPQKRPEAIADSIQLQQNTLYLLPSPLLFYGVETIVKKLPCDSAVLFIEQNAALFEVSHCFYNEIIKATETSQAGAYLLSPQNEDIKHCITSLSGWPFRRVELIVLNGGYGLCRDYYDRLFTVADKEIRLAHQDRLTQVYFARRWMKNLFSNLAFSHEINSFRMLGTDKPAVVAAAGESLEKSIPGLIERRESLYIVAADTALPVLCSNGIIPDAAVVLESQFINMRDFYGIPWQEIDLIADAYSHPPVLRLPWKNRFLFFTRFSGLNFFEQILEPAMPGFLFPAYGSVGVAAVAIAGIISSNAVYCTGLDFSYCLGKSHARGTQFGIQQLSEQSRVNPPGSFKAFINRPMLLQSGKKRNIRTDLILLNYLNPLQRIIDERKGIYDLNEDGLDIGAPWAALPEDTHNRFSGSTNPPEVTDFEEKCGNYLEKEVFHTLLKNELEELQKIHSKGYKFLTGEILEETLPQMITKHDYLLSHFPDPKLPAPLNPDYVKRVLLAAEGYIQHLKNLLTM